MTTALYRRYRPDTFADVIGQEHVTEPLLQALRTDRVTHAYLFSGPRGCGKTTSARILARCLNCAQGPTAEPCGTCDSCVDLACGGSGSLDVVEIDAASHGGVDDARELRERATFAPARDRYKIFILDEAHMVTSQGFNALLKIVEEPPPHVKFIFATTEPDKVIGTIRSRTHHYPFRLVGPATLQPYLEQICAAEGVPVGAGVLPLVVRAGGGSVRDSLSVLDQLVAGADESGIDYERAVALLGYTHAALLDDVVEAVAARDGGSAFRVVDRVVSSGHEPRRFVEDVLERLRDLIVIAASGDSAQAVLRDLPADQLERMRGQAAVLGSSELSRSADLVNAALSEMTGATSPRLHLELLVARLLLPAADHGAVGLGARLDRVERQIVSGVAPVAAATGAARPVAAPEPAQAPAPASAPAASSPTAAPRPPEAAARVPADAVGGPAASVASGAPHDAARPAVSDPATAAPQRPAAQQVPPASKPAAAQQAPAAAGSPPATVDAAATPATPTPATPTPATPTPATPPAATPPAADPPRAAEPSRAAAAPSGVDAEVVRRRWPEVLQTLRGLRMATWVLVSQNAQVGEVTATTLTLAFTTPQLATTFRTGPHPDNVQRALHETLGLDVRIETALAESAVPPSASSPGASAPGAPRDASGSGGSGSDASGSGGATSGGGGGSGGRTRPSTSEAEASWTTPQTPTTAPAGNDEVPDGPEPTSEPAPGPDDAPGRSSARRPGAPTQGGAASRPSTSRASSHRPATATSSSTSASSTSASTATSSSERKASNRPWERAGSAGVRPAAETRAANDGDDADPDDPDLASTGLVGAPLVAQMLGGTVIDEIPEGPA